MTATDELREKARLLRSHADGLSAPLVVPSTKELMALTMLDAANRMENAADIIDAATLGAGTCHDKGGTDENGQQVFSCDACGCVLSLYDRDGTNTLCTGFIYDYPRYCPSCGAKVVEG